MKRLAIAISAFFAGAAGCAAADGAPEPVNLFALEFDGPVAAITTNFAVEPGLAVRVTIYNNEDDFLEVPFAKREGTIDERGVAIVSLEDLKPGDYSLAAYLDENGDGKLNRGKVFGFPKEPLAFSNGVKIRLSKPSYEDTKVYVGDESIVFIMLDD